MAPVERNAQQVQISSHVAFCEIRNNKQIQVSKVCSQQRHFMVSEY